MVQAVQPVPEPSEVFLPALPRVVGPVAVPDVVVEVVEQVRPHAHPVRWGREPVAPATVQGLRRP